MKKVLLASTALVAFAGAASADVAISGFGEIGIYEPNTSATGAGSGAQLFTDVDVTFTMTGETDGGVAFGATVDLDESNAADGATNDNMDDGGATFFVSGGFGTVTVGDTDGALDWAMDDVGGAGAIADDHTAHAGYNGAWLDGDYDGQIVRYEYSFGDFGVAVSAESTNGEAAVGVDVGFGIGVTYDTSFSGVDMSFGLGYQTSDLATGAEVIENVVTTLQTDIDAVGVSVQASSGGFTGTINYTDYSGSHAALAGTAIGGGAVTTSGWDGDHLGLGVTYAMDAWTFHANYGKYELSDATFAAENEGFGLAINYDLGGGMVAQFGYGDSETTFTNNAGTTTTDTGSWSLGLAMSF